MLAWNLIYKGYKIDTGSYVSFSENLITVFYCGDDLVFRTVEEAKQFIDEITRSEEA